MKNIKLLFFAVLFAFTLFTISPAKADSQGNVPCGGTDPDEACGGGSGGSSLPIDTHVWFLIATAGIIGAKVTIKKSKAAKAKEPAFELQR